MLKREEYDRFRVAPTDPATLRARDVERLLKDVAGKSGGRLAVEKFAESIEGRPIYLARIGTGPKRVLLWSQMHGDEPTHTAVLLDLANYLLQSPAKPQAAEILSNCTMHFIPMLNPDGAEAVMRFNAQGIDINRDARRLATPEGRALRHAVDTVKPEFAFNLHNQHARTSVGKPPKIAAVSVLAPPPDDSGRESTSMHRAKQMCACFVEAVRPNAKGMISRYDDTYEPRAFGDTIQGTGAATMLVEAGGWPEPDIEPLTRLHFHGMLTTLHAIATDKYRDADVKIYETLPESNSNRQFDCLISNAQIQNAIPPGPFVADLGIEQTRTEWLSGRSQSDGKVVDLGDLAVLSANSNIDGSGCLILPGQIAFLEDWVPPENLPQQLLNGLLATGVTTVIGCVSLGDRESVESIGAARQLPCNWGFVGRIDTADSLERAELVERVASAANKGLLAIVSVRANEELWRQLDQIGLPLLRLNQLPTVAQENATYRDLALQTASLCKLLNLAGTRGRVGRDAFADLAIFDLGGKVEAAAAVNWGRLRRVIVAGETIWENGKRTGGTPGTFLRRT